MTKANHILLVEDSEAERYLFNRACRDSPFPRIVHEVADGAQALDFLHRRNGYEDAPVPDVVVLDLNLPKVSGHAVLTAMKMSDELKVIPVVILSVSDAGDDIQAAYEEGASAYIVKPRNVEHFFEAIRRTERFWLQTATLPSSRVVGRPGRR